MKIEKAFSTDLQKEVTTVEADAYYQAGQIKSKYNFCCPDKNCQASVTCANLNKPNHLRKKDPYFIFTSSHNEDICSVFDTIEYKEYNRKKDGSYSHTQLSGARNIILDISPPDNVIKKSVQKDSPEHNSKHTNTLIGGPNRIVSKSNNSTIRISSLVSTFLQQQSLTFWLEDEQYDINDFFIKINGQNIEELADEPRIYYGRAWINRLKNYPAFNIRFTEYLRHQDFTAQPSFLVPDSLIKAGKNPKYTPEKIQSLTGKIPVNMFIFSHSAPYVKPYKDKEYINIYLENIHYMEYRK